MTKREQTAVENFLGSLPDRNEPDAMHNSFENARMDRKLYKWSDEAMTAVVDGIGKHFAKPLPASTLPIDISYEVGPGGMRIRLSNPVRCF